MFEESTMRPKIPAYALEKETAILDAAQRRFAQFGADKVTMEEIAQEVGMGKASLYYYFPSKELLFRGVIHREQAQFLEWLRKTISSEATASQKLLNYTNQRIKFFNRLVNLNALSVQSILEIKPVFRELFESFGKEERQLISQIISEGIVAKELVCDQPEEFAKILLYALHGLRLRALRVAHQESQSKLDYRSLSSEMSALVNYMTRSITANQNQD